MNLRATVAAALSIARSVIGTLRPRWPVPAEPPQPAPTLRSAARTIPVACHAMAAVCAGSIAYQ